MTIFDLIFIIAFFTTVILLVAIAVAALRRRRVRGLLYGLGVFLTVYLGIIIAVSLLSPQRMIPLKEPQCFDDWCIAVEQAERTPVGEAVSYTVTLRLFSRARGRPQRENGVSVYVLDDRGRRYEAQADSQAVPLNVLLQPGESVNAVRKFLLPAEARNPGLVVAHGRFPGVFIIGDDQSLFHKSSLMRFP